MCCFSSLNLPFYLVRLGTQNNTTSASTSFEHFHKSNAPCHELLSTLESSRAHFNSQTSRKYKNKKGALTMNRGNTTTTLQEKVRNSQAMTKYQTATFTASTLASPCQASVTNYFMMPITLSLAMFAVHRLQSFDTCRRNYVSHPIAIPNK